MMESPVGTTYELRSHSTSYECSCDRQGRFLRRIVDRSITVKGSCICGLGCRDELVGIRCSAVNTVGEISAADVKSARLLTAQITTFY